MTIMSFSYRYEHTIHLKSKSFIILRSPLSTNVHCQNEVDMDVDYSTVDYISTLYPESFYYKSYK